MQVLLNRIQYHNDQQAFKQFYHLLFFKLYQFSYSYVSSKESAEELVNDVFLGLWEKRATFDTINNIQVYLYVAVKNASLNYLRSHRMPLPVSVDDLHVDHFYFATNPELTMINRELRMKLHEAIDQLPPRCKVIFKLVKEDGLSYKDVASILDISPKTVDSQLCLALKKLASLLQPIYS
jgi:RNA polymerase sigma-70 factor (family 1)